MSQVRVAVVYYSTYGTNHAMASAAAEAAREAGAEVRLRKVRETAPREVVEAQEAWAKHAADTAEIATAEPDDMAWADAYLFSSPTRYGGAASQMRSFIDTLGPLWMAGDLADKTATAMTSAQNPHGGQETTLQTLYVTFMHWGCILVPPGYTGDEVTAAGGNPYGVSVTATGDGRVGDADAAAIRHQARRLVEITRRLTG
jgi:NAD(P)H dehydrogenase (quinone)